MPRLRPHRLLPSLAKRLNDRRRASTFRTASGGWILPGLLRPDEVKELTRLTVAESPHYDTVAGFVMARLGRIAVVGDAVEEDGVRVTVERMDGRRVDRVRVEPAQPANGEGEQ